MLLLFDVRIVVTTISCSIVNNNSNQLEIIIISRMLEFEICTLCRLIKVFLGVFAQVELGRKFKIVIYFLPLHRVEVKLKTLECHYQISW
jgi:hypothetical protein